MDYEGIREQLQRASGSGNQLFSLEIARGEMVQVYPRSINHLDGDSFFIARSGSVKSLFILSDGRSRSVLSRFRGEEVDGSPLFKRCSLGHENALAVQEVFDFTRPVLIGLPNSVGFGDRLGIANPGHLRAIADTPLKAIVAQQSIRELERTERMPDEVMDAAVWAAFQEGFKQGFGADADHLKTTEHIDRMMKSGFTFFTFDPGAYVVNEAATLSESEVSSRLKSLPWAILADTPEGLLSRYEGRSFRIAEDFEIHSTGDEARRALVKYGAVIAHAVTLYRHLEEKYRGRPFEVELSVDETESPTTPFEHFLTGNELKRLGVKLISLAPRFVGDFEKGIDYKGDLNLFAAEYVKHAKIAEALGPYKISFHSGSDKFSAYEVVGKLNLGHVHVKTAGTSYLEALRTLAAKEPELFGEILDFSRGQFEKDRASYHVSARLDRVPLAKDCTPERFLSLFDENDARQVLHVSFGAVLTSKDATGKLLFKDRILRALEEHEEAHYENLRRHFRRHIEPFLK